MAVGEYPFAKIHSVEGIKLGTACAGIKSNDRDDLVVIEISEGSSCSAVFTRNAFAAAPITIGRRHISQANIRWLLINSGNANAGTGRQGIEDAIECCRTLAGLRGGQSEQVLPFSTGVIGEALPLSQIIDALPNALDSLSTAGWHHAAKAIMTTDTRPKSMSIALDLNGQSVIISGIAKGAGMIHPNMATMLSFIATDAKINPDLLNQCIKAAVDRSFNRITVDGDTSTNDACVLIATGRSNAPEIDQRDTIYDRFSKGLQTVCDHLAEAIIRDGEGATKLMRVNVTEAASDEEAHQVAITIAQSPLVKTALFASDPNWGRILAAVGRAGINDLDVRRVNISLGDVLIVKHGERSQDYSEQEGQDVMAKDEVPINISLGRGQSSEFMLGCDLSYDYVRINAEYRT